MSNDEIPRKATTIDELRRVCRPEPLSGKALEVFFVETGKARDPHRETRKNIEQALEDEFASVLLYGHPGSGKSTELNKFLAERDHLFLPVQFSVLDETPPAHARAEDLILVVIERLLNTVHQAKIGLDEKRLEQIYQWFDETTQEKRSSRETSAEIAAGGDTASAPLGKLLGLFARFKGEVKYNAYSDETSISVLRKRPADLIARANEILRAAQKGMKTKGDARKLLVVVEDMDKLDLKQARDIYVNNANLLVGLDVRVVYTIPIYLFHSPDANAFKARFTSCIPLPMIKVTEPKPEGKTTRAPGFRTVKKIVRERVDAGLIQATALDMLIERTGGVLRHVFEVLQRVSTMADVKTPIAKKHVEYGLSQVRKELWQMIALPLDPVPGAPNSVDMLYERLEECAKKQLAGDKTMCNSDAINQILLKSCALVEYNGEGWLGVHPLVIENLKKLGRLTEHEQ